MKRATIFLIALIILVPKMPAFNFSAGAFYGLRTVNEEELNRVYGSGGVYFPFVEINPWKGLMIGGGYEGGYSRDGEIGIFQEKSHLKIDGYELYLGWQFELGAAVPYLKVGYGYYSYKQTIESAFLEQYKVDDHAQTLVFGGGVKVYPFRNFFLAIEFKYVPLKVQPYEPEVDLGGLRIMAGLGITL